MKRPRKSLSIAQRLQPIADRFIATLESHIEREARMLAARWLTTAKVHQQRNFAEASHRPPRPPADPFPARLQAGKGRRLTPAPRIAASPPDPGEVARLAELNRLRSILRPVTEPQAASLAQAMPPAPPSAPAISADPVRALEGEIRDVMPFLATLPPDRHAAQIAAWAGRARLHQELPTDGRMRIAAGMLIEKLRGLARAMEVGRIDALAPGFETDWVRYVTANEAIAGGVALEADSPEADARPPDLADDYSSTWR